MSIRDRLLAYDSVIYDTNCVLYLRFSVVVSSESGSDVVIDEPPFSEATRDLTEFLRSRSKRVCTLQAAFDEATEELLARIARRRLSDPDVRQKLGLARGEQHSHGLEFQITRKARKKVRGLQSAPWFHVNDFWPRNSRIGSLRSELQKWFDASPTNDGSPSAVDVALIIYSGDEKLPLVSNDSDITTFAERLQAGRHAELIVALLDTPTT
jgi:hypothetical protein